MFIDRHEIGEPGQFARMTDEELEASLATQVRALGLPEEAIDLLLSNLVDRRSIKILKTRARTTIDPKPKCRSVVTRWFLS